MVQLLPAGVACAPVLGGISEGRPTMERWLAIETRACAAWLFPVAKWVGVYRSVQRPHPIHRPAGGCLRVHGQVEQADVLHSRPQPRRSRLRWPGEPLKRRERTQNDIAKTAAAQQTLQDAVVARADDEKYCDYRQEDWADAAPVCCPIRQPAHHDLQARHGWLLAGMLCWVGASLAGRCFVAGGYCVGMLIGVLLTSFSPGNVCAVRVCRSFQDTFKVVFAPFEADHQLVSLQRAGIIDIILSEDGDPSPRRHHQAQRGGRARR